jgi:hypothetical protein
MNATFVPAKSWELTKKHSPNTQTLSRQDSTVRSPMSRQMTRRNTNTPQIAGHNQTPDKS